MTTILEAALAAPTREQALELTNAFAQMQFRGMLDHYLVTGKWDPALVRAYTNAEEAIRSLLVDEQGLAAQAELDDALMAGEHFVGVGR